MSKSANSHSEDASESGVRAASLDAGVNAYTGSEVARVRKIAGAVQFSTGVRSARSTTTASSGSFCDSRRRPIR